MSEFKLEISSDGTKLTVRADFNLNREKIMAETTLELPVESSRQGKAAQRSDATSLQEKQKSLIAKDKLNRSVTRFERLVQNAF